MRSGFVVAFARDRERNLSIAWRPSPPHLPSFNAALVGERRRRRKRRSPRVYFSPPGVLARGGARPPHRVEAKGDGGARQRRVSAPVSFLDLFLRFFSDTHFCSFGGEDASSRGLGYSRSRVLSQSEGVRVFFARARARREEKENIMRGKQEGKKTRHRRVEAEVEGRGDGARRGLLVVSRDRGEGRVDAQFATRRRQPLISSLAFG